MKISGFQPLVADGGVLVTLVLYIGYPKRPQFAHQIVACLEKDCLTNAWKLLLFGYFTKHFRIFCKDLVTKSSN